MNHCGIPPSPPRLARFSRALSSFSFRVDSSFAPATFETTSIESPKNREESYGIRTRQKCTKVSATPIFRYPLLLICQVSLRRAKNSYNSMRSDPMTIFGFLITNRFYSPVTNSKPPTYKSS